MIFKKDLFLKSYLAKGYAKSTVHGMKLSLDKFFRWLDGRSVKDMTDDTMREYHYYLGNDYIPRRVKKLKAVSIVKELAIIKQYYLFLIQHKYLLELTDFSHGYSHKAN